MNNLYVYLKTCSDASELILISEIKKMKKEIKVILIHIHLIMFLQIPKLNILK